MKKRYEKRAKSKSKARTKLPWWHPGKDQYLWTGQNEAGLVGENFSPAPYVDLFNPVGLGVGAPVMGAPLIEPTGTMEPINVFTLVNPPIPPPQPPAAVMSPYVRMRPPSRTIDEMGQRLRLPGYTFGAVRYRPPKVTAQTASAQAKPKIIPLPAKTSSTTLTSAPKKTVKSKRSTSSRAPTPEFGEDSPTFRSLHTPAFIQPGLQTGTPAFIPPDPFKTPQAIGTPYEFVTPKFTDPEVPPSLMSPTLAKEDSWVKFQLINDAIPDIPKPWRPPYTYNRAGDIRQRARDFSEAHKFDPDVQFAKELKVEADEIIRSLKNRQDATTFYKLAAEHRSRDRFEAYKSEIDYNLARYLKNDYMKLQRIPTGEDMNKYIKSVAEGVYQMFEPQRKFSAQSNQGQFFVEAAQHFIKKYPPKGEYDF